MSLKGIESWLTILKVISTGGITLNHAHTCVHWRVNEIGIWSQNYLEIIFSSQLLGGQNKCLAMLVVRWGLKQTEALIPIPLFFIFLHRIGWSSMIKWDLQQARQIWDKARSLWRRWWKKAEKLCNYFGSSQQRWLCCRISHR